jgi:hypothetical protein
MLNTPTLLQTWSAAGRRCGLLSVKGKTGRLLGAGVDYVVSTELVPPEIAAAIGTPPSIYTIEVNAWLVRCLEWLIANRPDLDTFYVHTTDYPMHRWAPGEAGSQEHLRQLDAAIRKVVETLGDAEVFLTADHGMNAKTRALDLGRILTARGIAGAWVWTSEADRDRAAEILASLDGVEEVTPAPRRPPGSCSTRPGWATWRCWQTTARCSVTSRPRPMSSRRATVRTVPPTSARSPSSAGTSAISGLARSP